MVHSLDPNFSIQCDFVGCSRTFKNFRTYQNHRNSHRKSERGEEAQDTFDIDSNSELDADRPSYQYTPPTETDMQSYAARWILGTSEKRSLTRIASLGIVEDVSTLIKFVTEVLQQQVGCILRENGINSSAVTSGLDDIFASPVTTPFNGLLSFYQQLQYYGEHFNFIVSFSIEMVIPLKNKSIIMVSL